MAKKRLLFIGDGVAPTGFATVMTNIIKNLPKRSYDIHHLAVNYRGDPHDHSWRIYPAQLGGDAMGFNRLPTFESLKPHGIFILNDPWIIKQYLKIIKTNWETIPPIVVYFPVDSIDLDPSWFQEYDMVNRICVYTEFGYREVNKVLKGRNIDIVPHGVNKNLFKKIEGKTKKDIKNILSNNDKDFEDSFVVLNANRNQPRKRVDITIQGFSAFSAGKPSNVKLYLHMGVEDEGFNILKLASRFGISDRLIISGKDATLQSIPEEKLNIIYNATDVGLNTAIGEGWSLTNMEHAVTGAPQIVPDHSALKELYSDCGLLMPVDRWLTNKGILTISGFVQPLSVAEKLEEIYSNKELYNELSEKTFKKFTDKKYEWSNIVKNSWLPIFRDTYD